MKFHEDILNGFKLQCGHDFVTQTAIYKVQMDITQKYISKIYVPYALHVDNSG